MTSKENFQIIKKTETETAKKEADQKEKRKYLKWSSNESQKRKGCN